MKDTCCPQYTIRCDAKNFTLNHSHKKVLKKMHNYLSNKEDSSNAKNNDSTATPSKVKRDSSSSSIRNPCQTTEVKLKEEKQDQPSEQETAELANVAISKGPQKKAKILRLERRLNKQKSKPEVAALPKPASEKLPKTLEDYLMEGPSPLHHLQVKLVSSSSSEFKESLLETHKLYVKYQMIVHEDKEEECTIEQFKRFLVKTPLQVYISNLIPDSFFCINPCFFNNFCKQSCKHPDDKTHPGYGSFHQQYWLDGKLIAVGVIDLLPTVLSSVYFFYDPDLNFLSLGTYASLRYSNFVHHIFTIDFYLFFYLQGNCFY